MSSEKKLTLTDFIIEDRFELSSYLTYLLNEYDHEANQQIQKKDEFVN